MFLTIYFFIDCFFEIIGWSKRVESYCTTLLVFILIDKVIGWMNPEVEEKSDERIRNQP